jgi:NADPH2:quinone reductase
MAAADDAAARHVPGATRGTIAPDRQGRLRPVVGGEYPLDEAHRAHADLLSRRSTGKLILRP